MTKYPISVPFPNLDKDPLPYSIPNKAEYVAHHLHLFCIYSKLKFISLVTSTVKSSGTGVVGNASNYIRAMVAFRKTQAAQENVPNCMHFVLSSTISWLNPNRAQYPNSSSVPPNRKSQASCL